MIKGNKVIAHNVNPGLKPSDSITLSYDDRFRRRIVMRTDGGKEFLLDLVKTAELRSGDLIALDLSLIHI